MAVERAGAASANRTATRRPHRSTARHGWASVWLAVLLVACAPANAPASPAAGAPGPTQAAAQPTNTGSGTPLTLAPREHLRVGYPTAAISNSTLAAAQEGGYYAAQNLDVEVVWISGGPNLLGALIAGELQAAVVAAAPAVSATFQGADLITIAQPITRFTLVMYSRPELTTPESLRGKRVGVVALGSGADTAMRHGLRHFGLDPDQDATFVRTGGAPETLAGLMAGAIDVGALPQPLTLQARHNGLTELLDLSTLDVEYPIAGVVSSRRLVAEREEALRGFLRAMGQATQRMKADREFAFRVISRYTGVDDLEALEEGYQATIPLFRKVPTPTRGSTLALMEEVAATLPSVRQTDPGQYYDTHLVDRLEAEGFYRQLYGR
jgi:ABC-type nitrate/sulfonate/bicarbonate transport system substrate-binding protein